MCYPLLFDLECKLLINCTDEDLITSDNPVILYNQLLGFRKNGSDTGFACKGLQIFFPLNPRSVLVLYDAKSYRLGNDKYRTISITKHRDIYELNTLQCCSCLENIYFTNENFDCDSLFRKAKPFLRKNLIDFKTYPQPSSNDEVKELLMTSREDLRINMKLSFLTIRKSTKKWIKKFRKQNVQPAAIVRNQEIVDIHRDFFDAVKNQEVQAMNFIDYLNKETANSM